MSEQRSLPSGPTPAAPTRSAAPEAPGSATPPASLASPELAERAGAVMSRPEVLEARARVLEARETFSSELATLKGTTRATFDPRVRVSEAAESLSEDPRRLVGVAAAVGGGLLGLRFLRGRKSKAPSTLPPDVESALAGMGDDGKAVRAALDRSFTRYLQEHGAEPAKRSKIPRGIGYVVLPVATQIGREVVRQAFRRRDETS
jgi:hypothetical protein